MCRYRQTIANLRSAGAAHLTSPPPKEGYGAGTYLRIWLRRLDSNQRPLGYGPNELPTATTPPSLVVCCGEILPFSLGPQTASFHQVVTRRIVDRHRYGYPQIPAGIWLGWQDLNLRMPESKSGALPLGDIPI